MHAYIYIYIYNYTYIRTLFLAFCITALMVPLIFFNLIYFFHFYLSRHFNISYSLRGKWKISHVVRSEGPLKVVMKGRMMGNRTRGRPRMGMIDDLMEGMYAKMKKRVEDREMEGPDTEDLPIDPELTVMIEFKLKPKIRTEVVYTIFI